MFRLSVMKWVRLTRKLREMFARFTDLGDFLNLQTSSELSSFVFEPKAAGIFFLSDCQDNQDNAEQTLRC